MDKPSLCNGLALLAGHCPGLSKPGLHGRKQHQLVAYVQGIRQEFAADATQLSIGMQSAFFLCSFLIFNWPKAFILCKASRVSVSLGVLN